MIAKYNPQEIEKKWQQRWAEDKLYEVTEDSTKPKWYALTMFPYTSGDLHIGHWYAMAPSDVHARFKRMQGYNVLHPMGFDSFGLNAENAAISRGIHPYTWTAQNIDNMRRQLKSIGAIYGWSREVITSQPDYYKWTQWFFLKLYQNGLAYRGKAPVNWCPRCQTVLANEQVVGGGIGKHGQRIPLRLGAIFGGATYIAPVPMLPVIFVLGTVLKPSFAPYLGPLFVGAAAGLGETIGALTIYMTGYGGGTALASTKHAKVRAIYSRLSRWMKRRGSLVLFIFSSVVNPFFYPIAITAGATRFGLKKYLLICIIGKTIKGTTVAAAGYWGLGSILRALGVPI